LRSNVAQSANEVGILAGDGLTVAIAWQVLEYCCRRRREFAMTTRTKTPVPSRRARKSTLRFQVTIRQAEEGGYLGIVPTLPAAYSQGETVEETLERTTEAIRGVLKFHLERNMEVPSEPAADFKAQKGDIAKWVEVHV
jgi:predicted RNase H-like HicB family nuclease